MKTFLKLLFSFMAGVMVCCFFFFRIWKNNDYKTITTHGEVVERIEAIGKLELVKVNIRDVLEHEFIRQWLPNPSALLIISGEAAGCVDLQKLSPEDIVIKSDTLYLTLPAPELCYCKIDHKKSRVYETRYDYFSGADLVDSAFREAEKQLEKTVLKMGILEQTKQNAGIFFTSFSQSFGFSKVEISFAE